MCIRSPSSTARSTMSPTNGRASCRSSSSLARPMCLGINSERFRNFKDMEGHPGLAVPGGLSHQGGQVKERVSSLQSGGSKPGLHERVEYARHARGRSRLPFGGASAPAQRGIHRPRKRSASRTPGGIRRWRPRRPRRSPRSSRRYWSARTGRRAARRHRREIESGRGHRSGRGGVDVGIADRRQRAEPCGVRRRGLFTLRGRLCLREPRPGRRPGMARYSPISEESRGCDLDLREQPPAQRSCRPVRSE